MADDVAQFLTGHQLRLSRLALVLSGDHHLAQDLVQDTMVKIVRKWDVVRRSDDPTGYTAQMMINQWRDSARSFARRRAREGLATIERSERSDDDADDVAELLDQITLRQAMALLTEKQRLVLYLRFFEDRPVAEAARLLGCAEGTVKSQTSAAIRSLHEHLEVSVDD